MLACIILSPSANTVYRLGASTGGARLVVVGLRASITAVSSIGSDLVEFASSVLVVTSIVVT